MEKQVLVTLESTTHILERVVNKWTPISGISQLVFVLWDWQEKYRQEASLPHYAPDV